MSKSATRLFHELPQALVKDMLNQCDDISSNLTNSFRKVFDLKEQARITLKERNLLKNESALPSSLKTPTSCGIDGAYAVEKLLSTDLIAIAGLALEGLAPPSEQRHWPIPRHDYKITTIPHNESTTVSSGAIMMCFEMNLAANAPHNVVFLDGSLITPFIYIIKALNLTVS
ncbi:MAG: nuclease, partial [Candidatus Lokiarchaeota archaeon]|nr:nuclease [Candidatus Lokiarchaeota archaeon]MBD3340938.1 nuclease [Candidatus Lokiarchaeota archaeon]